MLRSRACVDWISLNFNFVNSSSGHFNSNSTSCGVWPIQVTTEFKESPIWFFAQLWSFNLHFMIHYIIIKNICQKHYDPLRSFNNYSLYTPCSCSYCYDWMNLLAVAWAHGKNRRFPRKWRLFCVLVSLYCREIQALNSQCGHHTVHLLHLNLLITAICPWLLTAAKGHARPLAHVEVSCAKTYKCREVAMVNVEWGDCWLQVALHDWYAWLVYRRALLTWPKCQWLQVMIQKFSVTAMCHMSLTSLSLLSYFSSWLSTRQGFFL